MRSKNGKLVCAGSIVSVRRAGGRYEDGRVVDAVVSCRRGDFAVLDDGSAVMSNEIIGVHGAIPARLVTALESVIESRLTTARRLKLQIDSRVLARAEINAAKSGLSLEDMLARAVRSAAMGEGLVDMDGAPLCLDDVVELGHRPHTVTAMSHRGRVAVRPVEDESGHHSTWVAASDVRLSRTSPLLEEIVKKICSERSR